MDKKYLHIILLFFISFHSFAQIKIITQTDSLFFVGIENKVTITPGKIPFEKLHIIITGGFISGSLGNYVVRCITPGTQVSIKVLYNKKVIAAKQMQAVRISNPQVFIAGDTLVNGGLISKKHLMTLNSYVVKTNVPFLQMAVTKFDYKRISNNNTIDSINSFGNIFSKTLKNLFKQAISGDTLIFENIYAIGPDDSGIEYISIKLTVTD